MTHTKANNGTPLLDYIINGFYSSRPSLLGVVDDFTALGAAGKVSLVTERIEVGKIRARCAEIENTSKADAAFAHALSGFLSRAQGVRDRVIEKLENSSKGFDDLCNYLGTPPQPKTNSEEFFTMMNKFVKLLAETIKKIKARKEREAKAEKRKQSSQTMKKGRRPSAVFKDSSS